MLVLLVGLCCLSVVSCHLLSLREGAVCRALNGSDGVCKIIFECSGIGDFKKNQPPICAFKGKVPVICCPESPPKRMRGGTKVEEYCRWIEANHCKVGLPKKETSRKLPGCIERAGVKAIVGGYQALPREYKHMALIGFGNETDILWRCGGSLISTRYVLSAAHCVNQYSVGPAKWAKMGDLDIHSTSEDANPVTKMIVERITYPDYVATQHYHDIALFKLDSDVVFNPWVMPVCLHTKREIPSTVGDVAGWGSTGFGEGTSEKLLAADLNIYNETECARLFPSDLGTPKGYQADLMFCAGVQDASRDTCLGDSGGPLMIWERNKILKTLVGITSYGKQCALRDSPGVYTRVSNYIPWIEDIVFPSE